MHLPGIVTTAFGTRRVLLLDLSLRGARFRCNGSYELEQQVVLQWNRNQALGFVCWRDGQECGLTFYRSLTVRMLIDTRDLDQACRLDVERDMVRRTSDAFVNGRVRL